jgi:3-isopropylmalate/(R)-2-methylmalate dehydratase small subunit
MMSLAERDPATSFVVDLQSMQVTAAGQSFEIALPASAREAFLDGSWDATGLLLDDYDVVRGVAASLPYVTSRW